MQGLGMKISTHQVIIGHLVDWKTLRKSDIRKLKDHRARCDVLFNPTDKFGIAGIFRFELRIGGSSILRGLVEYSKNQNQSCATIDPNSACPLEKPIQQVSSRKRGKKGDENTDAVVASDLRRDQQGEKSAEAADGSEQHRVRIKTAEGSQQRLLADPVVT